jgi:acrylyl-CoA reductase (NADPH)
MTESKHFRALQVEETAPGQFTRRVIERSLADLPAGDVLVRVRYSSLNYKDALSATGNRGVTRKYPHIPGIDAAGVVETSESPDYKPGDKVLVTSSEMGVNHPGGYEQYVCVPSSWLVKVPGRLTLRQSMAYGTAGFTAAMCVNALQQAGIGPDQGEILVTGATGGVGSIAVGILAKEKYKVDAATGKPENNRLLHALGAEQVISRDEVNDTSGKALLHARWAGVIDTVGGNILATAIRSTRPGGAVAACGNAASADLNLTVYPFILRGVRLLGIDATLPTHAERVQLWRKLAGKWKLEVPDELTREVKLDQLDEEIQRILNGGQTGRVIVNLE